MQSGSFLICFISWRSLRYARDGFRSIFATLAKYVRCISIGSATGRLIAVGSPSFSSPEGTFSSSSIKPPQLALA